MILIDFPLSEYSHTQRRDPRVCRVIIEPQPADSGKWRTSSDDFPEIDCTGRTYEEVHQKIDDCVRDWLARRGVPKVEIEDHVVEVYSDH